MRDAQPRVVVAALGVLATAFCSMAVPSAGECAETLASTLTVGDSCTYADLQAAVDAAVSGDTILVQGKTFTGSDAFTMIDDKSLTIVGGYDATCSSLDGSRSILDITAMGASAFWINGRGGSSIVIERFDITGGDIYSANGCGIHTFNQGNVTLIDVDIYGNNANFGGGVSVEDGSLHLKAGSRISGNSASGGGGVFCQNATVTIEASEIGSGDLGGNTSSHEGGGMYLWGCTLEVGTATGNGRIQFNSALYDGGGIYAHSTDILVNGANATVNDNTSGSQGGGLYLRDASTFTATGGGVENNVSASDGGGFYAIDSGTSIKMDGSGCTSNRCARISNNQCATTTAGYGGGIFLNTDTGPETNLDLKSVHLDYNSSGDSSGSIIFAVGTIEIDSAMITNNLGGTLGLSGSAEIRSTTIANNITAGGFVFSLGAETTVTAQGLIVWGNDHDGLTGGVGTFTIDHSVEQYGVGGTNIVADPLFIDPTAGNYHIQLGSPAVDLSPSGSAVDIDCEPRPLGAAWDAGADEEWASTINIFIDGFETGNTNAWSTTVGGV